LSSLLPFAQVLAQHGKFKRISQLVKAELQITEIDDRLMKTDGPALHLKTSSANSYRR
jgi:3-polyprenyl-4-hydroxybenzoate decarboxylase